MATRRATGKKSQAISDQSGFKIPYTSLKTTWEGYRVEPEEWEPKQPQLTPAKNVIDATALFQPRPDNDEEITAFYVGFNYDIFADRRAIPNMPHGVGGVASLNFTNFETGPEATGVAGTGNTGIEGFAVEVTGVSGNGSTGAVGVEALEVSISEAGVAGTGAVGAEVPEASITEAGVAGTGAVGNEDIDITGWGLGTWGSGVWNDSVSPPVSAGVTGTGAVGSESIETDTGWGTTTWGTGAWSDFE
tara:strand:- start:597 stop:1337 length:741 start_codon:yes stop_codon:yes gene_type:complete